MSTYRSSRYGTGSGTGTGTGINGYRSQPSSNRNSLYLSNDYGLSSGLSSTYSSTSRKYGSTTKTNDLSDFDRQFKRLLDRTEKFTTRVEKLQTTASSLNKGYRGYDRYSTGRQREHVSLYDTLIDTDPVSTEDEWRRYVNRGCLVEKAVEALRRRHRYPKESFEYSPESRSPYSYSITPTTKWVSNPHTPTDKYGRKVRDKGMEEFERNVIKDPSSILLFNTEEPPKPQPTLTPRARRKLGGKENGLASVQEAENEATPSATKSSTNSIKALRAEIIENDKDIKPLAARTVKDSPWKIDRKTKESPEKDRKWLSLEAEDKKKKRKSFEDELPARGKKEKEKDGKSQKSNKTEEDTVSDKKQTKTHKLFDSIKHSTIKRSKSRGKSDSRTEKLAKEKLELEKTKEPNDNNIDNIENYDKPDANAVKYRDEHVSSKARPTTMYDLELNDESDKKESGSLKPGKTQSKDSQRNSSFLDDEALRKNKSSSSFHEYIPGHNVPLKERLRRKQMEQEEREQKEKTTLTTSTTDFRSVIVPDRSLAQRASKIIKAKYHGGSDATPAKDREDSTTSPAQAPLSGRSSLTSKFFRRFMGGEKEEGKATSEENNSKASSIRRRRLRKDSDNDNDNDDISNTSPKNVVMNTTISASKTDNPSKLTESKTSNSASRLHPHMADDLTNHAEKTPERFRRRLILNDENSTSSNMQKAADKTKDEDKKDDSTASVVRRRKKEKDEEKIKLQELQRKSLFVFENEIVPSEKRAERLRFEFRSPDRSRDEIEEEIMRQEKVRYSTNLTDDIFDCLKETEVSEDSDLSIEKKQDTQIDDDLFACLDQMTPDEDKPAAFFIGEDNTCAQNEPIENNTRELSSFMEPIEHENELKIQHLDDMFDEIDSINQSMYEELLNLTKQETPHQENEGKDSDDEVFGDPAVATGGSSKTVYDPTSKPTKQQKKKIDKGDLMATDKFEATKERWGIRSLSRGISFDGSISKPASSKPRSRNDSTESKRSSSLLETHDDAVKYVAKYTNKTIEELKAGVNGVDVGGRTFAPSSNEGGNAIGRIEDVSEVEKARNDVDKMLLNCQNIDKINNSLTETVTPSATVTMLKDTSTQYDTPTSHSQGTDTVPADCVTDTDITTGSFSREGASEIAGNELEETTRRISLLIEQAEEFEGNPELEETRKADVDENNVNADEEIKTSLDNDYVIIDASNDSIHEEEIKAQNPEAEHTGQLGDTEIAEPKKERSLSQLSVNDATDSVSAYSPTISEYGTPPKSPYSSDMVVYSPESQNNVTIEETVGTSQSQLKEETEFAESTQEQQPKPTKAEEHPQSEQTVQSPDRTQLREISTKNKQDADEKKKKRRSSYMSQRQSHMGLFSLASTLSFDGGEKALNDATIIPESLNEDKAPFTSPNSSLQHVFDSENIPKESSIEPQVSSNLSDVNNLKSSTDSLGHTADVTFEANLEKPADMTSAAPTNLDKSACELFSSNTNESHISLADSTSDKPNDSSLNFVDEALNPSESPFKLSKKQSLEKLDIQTNITKEDDGGSKLTQNESPSKLVKRPSLGSISSLTGNATSTLPSSINNSQDSIELPFKLVTKSSLGNVMDDKIDQPESPFKLTKRPSMGSLTSLTSLTSTSMSQIDTIGHKPEQKDSPFKLTKKPSLGSLASLTALTPTVKAPTTADGAQLRAESPFKLTKKPSLSGSLTSLANFGALPTGDGAGPFKLSKVSSTSRLSLLQSASIPSIKELPTKQSSQDETREDDQKTKKYDDKTQNTNIETREAEDETFTQKSFEEKPCDITDSTQKIENEWQVSEDGTLKQNESKTQELEKELTKSELQENATEDAGEPSNKHPTEDTGEPSNKHPTEDTGEPSNKHPTEDTGEPSNKHPTEDTGEPLKKHSIKEHQHKDDNNNNSTSSHAHQTVTVIEQSPETKKTTSITSSKSQLAKSSETKISISKKSLDSTNSRKGSESNISTSRKLSDSKIKISSSRKASESGISSDIKENLSRSQSHGSSISPSSGLSSDDDVIIKRDGRPVLEKQLSIKEYRLKKMQREGTFESVSDDGQSKSDLSAVSSLADISDASVEENNTLRQKKYSHSKKDLRNIGICESSSSESDFPMIKTTGQRISERLERLKKMKPDSTTFNLAETNDNSSVFVRSTTSLNTLNGYSRSTRTLSTIRTWHSSGETEPNRTSADRRRDFKRDFKSVDRF